MFLFGGTYTLISGNITKDYLCARAFQHELQNDVSFAYLALVINAQSYLNKGTISKHELRDICIRNASIYDKNVVDFLLHIIMDTECLYFSIAKPRLSSYAIRNSVQSMSDKITKSIIKELQECKIGLRGPVAKVILENYYEIISEAKDIASEIDLFFG